MPRLPLILSSLALIAAPLALPSAAITLAAQPRYARPAAPALPTPALKALKTDTDPSPEGLAIPPSPTPTKDGSDGDGPSERAEPHLRIHLPTSFSADASVPVTVVVGGPESASFRIACTSDDGATISGPTVSGQRYRYLLTDRKAGQHSLVVTVEEPSGTSSVQRTYRVTPGALARLVLHPLAADMPADGQSTLEVTSYGTDAFGNPVVPPPTVSVDGQPLQAENPGTFLLPPTSTSGTRTIIAREGLLRAEATVDALPAPALHNVPLTSWPAADVSTGSVLLPAGQSAVLPGTVSSVSLELQLASGGSARVSLGDLLLELTDSASSLSLGGTTLWTGPGVSGTVAVHWTLLAQAAFLTIGGTSVSVALPTGTPLSGGLSLTALGTPLAVPLLADDANPLQGIALGGGEGSPAWVTVRFWNDGGPIQISLSQMTTILSALVTTPAGTSVSVTSEEGTVTLPGLVGFYSVNVSWDWYPGSMRISYSGNPPTVQQAPYSVQP